jgi:hypothetical protein
LGFWNFSELFDEGKEAVALYSSKCLVEEFCELRLLRRPFGGWANRRGRIAP